MTKKVKTSIVLSSTLVLAAVGIFIWSRVHNHQSETSKADQQTVAKSGINLDPPTKTEQQETNDHKDQLIKDAQNSSASQTGHKDVTPLIINAFFNGDKQQVTISGFVPGVLEDGGTCTAVLTAGGSSFSRTSSGSANVGQTDCAPIIISRSEFPKSGVWQVALSYVSSTASGTSQPKSITVP